MRILIVDVDTRSASALCRSLAAQGLEVETEGDLHRAEQRPAGRGYALVMLNLTPLGREGVRALERLKRRLAVPVLAITGTCAPYERLAALRAGADDCVDGSVACEELVVRMRTVLRRGLAAGTATGGRVALDDLVVDTTRRTASRGGVRLNLSALEFKLLAALLRNPGHVLSRADVVDAVWGDVADVDPRVVEVAICRLRAKVDRPYAKKLVRTLRGAGYLLDATHGNSVKD
ncbi:MAG: hypothetical protein ABT20_03030 [Rubrivivax sp. SCN 70-15]|nr:MAG: hypothetical protein ABT20_03030 [Rubrivivax sp. SCN 70-15]